MSPRVPELLYHASPMCVADKIEMEGLKAASFAGIFASSTPEDTLRFMAFRLFYHVHVLDERPPCPACRAAGEVTVNGITRICHECWGRGFTRTTKIEQHPFVYVWTIDTTIANKGWQVGNDHSPGFFGYATSWEYNESSIGVEALRGYNTYSREVSETVSAD